MRYKLILILTILGMMLSACGGAPAAPAEPALNIPPAEPTTVIQINQPAENTNASGFTLSSPDLPADGRLPVEYTCDGDGSTLALTWSGAPAGTQSYAVIMHHVAAPDDIHWYWVLYDIPTSITSLPKNVSGIGTLGNNVNNGLVEYSPPCSQGPGDKEYIYTVYALSAQPQISVPAAEVNRAVLMDAIKDITLTSAELHTVYARQGMEDPQAQASQPEAGAQPQGQGGGTPPAEAIAACTGKVEQDSCSFTDQNGEHTGVCKTNPDNQFACAPDRDGQGGQQGGG
jgi:Raf kinase inhibitor-like YbhB/YbcL family protein